MATANPTTLAAASAALAMLLENGASQPVSTNGLKTRRKKVKRTTDEATRKAEEEKKIEESVRALKRAKVRKEEIEVRERILAMREEQSGKKSKKRKATTNLDDSDSD